MTGSCVVRSTLRFVGVVLVVALALLLVLRVYGNRRFAAAERTFAATVGPREGDPYASPRVADEDNAAIYLRAGSEAVILSKSDQSRTGELTTTPIAAWTGKDRALLQRVLKHNAPPLELLHRAPDFPTSSFGLRDQRTDDFASKVPLLKLLWAQRLLYLESCVALQEHDLARFHAAAKAMSTMAGALEQESPAIVLLIGIACEKIFISGLKEAIANPSTQRETLAELQRMVLDTDLEAAWRRSNLAEQVEMRIAMSDPAGTHKQKLGLYGRFLKFAVGKIFQAQQLELRADLINALDQPLGLEPEWSRRGAHRPSGIFTMFQVFESVMFGPAPNRIVGRMQSTLSLRDAVRIALAVRLQGLERGAYPETLASIPGAAHPDPFAGTPLTYERLPDGSARMSVPRFEELWKRISDASASSQPYLWELPAPARTAPPGR